MRFPMATAIAVLALSASVALAACGGDSDNENESVVEGQFALVADAPDGYDELAGEAVLDRTEDGTEATIELTGLEPDAEYVAHVHAAGCDQPDPGGPHYKFDPNGSDMPPNEIHFSLTANAEGEGEAEASNERTIPAGDAGSIVVHSAEEMEAMEGGSGEGAEHGEGMEHGEGAGHSHSDKIACAELEGGTAPAEGTADHKDGHEMEEGGAAGGEGSTAAGAGATTIVVREGEPVGGVAELEYDAGEEVRFAVRSDTAEEIHVHGYDLSKDVPAGGTVRFAFPAEIEGIFEIELEELGVQIAELQVNP